MTPSDSVPYGFCQCGCGQKTRIAPKTARRNGYIKGLPMMWVNGHQSRRKGTPEAAVPFKIDGVYCRLISLSQGLYTIVDAADYERVSRWTWHAHRDPRSRSYYAKRAGRQWLGEKIGHVAMHREILGLSRDDPRHGDHRNHNGLDNRRANLRIATRSENQCNREMPRNNKSGYKGVYQHGETGWRAFVDVQGVRFYLGTFRTREQAHAARTTGAQAVHGEFFSG